VTSKVLLALVLSQYVRSKVDDALPNSSCLFWLENTTIEYRQNQLGNPETGDSVFAAANAAVATWQAQLESCGNLTFHEGPRTATRTVGYTGTGSDENVILYRQVKCTEKVPSADQCWQADTCGSKYDCWDHSAGAIAITTTSFHPTSGRLYDADIELNTPGYIFSTVDSPVCVAPNYKPTCVSTDVQNTLTHELGHVLGLGHINVAGSTMAPRADPGELSKRILDPGTKQFVCDVYPKGKPSKSCELPPVSATTDGGVGPAELGKALGCEAAPGPLLALVGLLWAVGTRRRA
jgi:hypothetical protein